MLHSNTPRERLDTKHEFPGLAFVGVSWFFVSWLLDFLVSKFVGFLDVGFLVSCMVHILPTFNFMFSGRS